MAASAAYLGTYPGNFTKMLLTYIKLADQDIHLLASKFHRMQQNGNRFSKIFPGWHPDTDLRGWKGRTRQEGAVR